MSPSCSSGSDSRANIFILTTSTFFFYSVLYLRQLRTENYFYCLKKQKGNELRRGQKDKIRTRQPCLTSCLYAKVDLALRRVSDGVAAKVNIRTVGWQEIERKNSDNYLCLQLWHRVPKKINIYLKKKNRLRSTVRLLNGIEGCSCLLWANANPTATYYCVSRRSLFEQ